MKYLCLLLFCCWQVSSWAQAGKVYAVPPNQYPVLLDSVPCLHHIIAQKADSDVVGVQFVCNLELFNLLVPMPRATAELSAMHQAKRAKKVAAPPDTLLIVMAVLPDPDGKQNWVPLALDEVPASQRLQVDELIDQAQQQVENYTQAHRPLSRELLSRENIIPVIRKGRQYYRPLTYVLTETYLIRPGAGLARAQADMLTIDVKSSLVTTAEVRKAAAGRGSRQASAEQLWETTWSGNLLRGRSHGRYEFWSSPLPQSHPNPAYGGAGNFIYQPGIGLVSGRYTTYFMAMNERYPYINRLFDVISIDGKPSKSTSN